MPGVALLNWPFFVRFADISQKRAPTRVLISCLMRLQRSSIRSNIVKTSRVCEGHPLDRAAGGTRTPRGATVPRESSYSYDQFGARQSRPRQENSWRIRVDLAFLCR